jgi:hypothetical protein
VLCASGTLTTTRNAYCRIWRGWSTRCFRAGARWSKLAFCNLDHRTVGAHPVTAGKSCPPRIHRAAASARASSCRQGSRRTHDRIRLRERTARRGSHLARVDQLGLGASVLVSDPAVPRAGAILFRGHVVRSSEILSTPTGIVDSYVSDSGSGGIAFTTSRASSMIDFSRSSRFAARRSSSS